MWKVPGGQGLAHTSPCLRQCGTHGHTSAIATQSGQQAVSEVALFLPFLLMTIEKILTALTVQPMGQWQLPVTG